MSLVAQTSRNRRTSLCIHCSTPYEAKPDSSGFCCAGCQFVHELLGSQGLDNFYNLKSAALPPVKALVFQKRDYSWLKELADAAERNASGDEAILTLDLQGISCLGCVWLMERLFQRRPGALAIDIHAALGRMELHWTPTECDLVAFAEELQKFGYLLGPLDLSGGSSANASGEAPSATQPLVRRLGLCGAFAMNAMLFTVPLYFGMTSASVSYVLFLRLAFVFASLSFFTGGSYFIVRAWRGLSHGMLNIELPIALGLAAAYAGSLYAWLAGATSFVYFDFVSTFSFLMLLGRWVQQAAVEKNRNRLLASPCSQADVIDPESSTRLPAQQITKSMTYIVVPGGVLPVRSKVLSAAATLSLEWINGESEAHCARIGQLVPSGAVNCSQDRIWLEAVESWNESILSSLLKVHPKAHRNAALERFVAVYIAFVLLIAAAGFAYTYSHSHYLLRALQVLISVLVVSCPCAAGVALPLADELAAASLRKIGLFVREQSLWSRLLKVRKIVFDKTGTLTLETMALQNADSPDGPEALAPERKSLLLGMVSDNFHPVSCALREVLVASGVAATSLEAPPREVAGFGLEICHENAIWRLGRPAWCREHSSSFPSDTSKSDGAGTHDCAFARNGIILARFRFQEEARPDASGEIAALEKRGYPIYLLSGDRQEKVQAMAAKIGLHPARCHAGMTPQQKADWIRQADAEDTLMIGDGANDSLAFNESFCTGTPAIDRGLLENKADFYFLGRGIGGLRQLLEMAVRRRNTGRRVLAFTTTYNAVAIAICLHGSMSPLLASILMPASSLFSIGIVLASLRQRHPAKAV